MQSALEYARVKYIVLPCLHSFNIRHSTFIRFPSYYGRMNQYWSASEGFYQAF
jgi:hypothetical protein